MSAAPSVQIETQSDIQIFAEEILIYYLEYFGLVAGKSCS
jgi:hypothetical protein